MMAKRSLMIIMMCLCIVSPAVSWGTLYYYSGAMDANFEITHTDEITVPSGLNSLNYKIPLPEDYSLPTNTQDATDPVITSSGSPSETDFTDEHGNHYTRLTWTNPEAGTITVTIMYTVTVHANWDGFVTSDPFPLNSSGLSDSITTFLDPTDEVQSDNSTLADLAETLTSGVTTQWEAVLAICGWVMDHITYDSNDDTDALSTYNDGYGVCTNYSHLAIALLRAAGIPARFSSGDSLYRYYTLPTEGGGYVGTSWMQGAHAWIEVYYPSLGWVPCDPQRDLHHIDTYRVLSGIGRDTTEGQGGWSYTYTSPPSSSLLISSTLDVDWLSDPGEEVDLTYIKDTTEIDDFSLSTAVNFIEIYTITASTGSGGSISPSGQVSVSNGSSQAFTITPDYNYEIADVLVDGESVCAVTSYTFSDVSADHTINATFVVDSDGDIDDDGLPDSWEQQIVDYNQSDEIASIQDVLPENDFDGDGFTNIAEYQRGTDPTDSNSHPSKFMPWLQLLLEE